MIIDATKKLTIRHFKKFEQKCEDSIEIQVNDVCVGVIEKIYFPMIFMKALFSDIEEGTLSFFSGDVQLKISIADYKKWTNPWWASRIFKEDDTMPAPTMNIIECFLAKRKLDTMTVYDEISTSSSNKKDIVNFINDNKAKLEIQAKLENAEVVYLLRTVGDENQFFRNEDELLLNGIFVM